MFKVKSMNLLLGGALFLAASALSAQITVKNGDRIDLNALSRRLGVPVVQTSALKGEGAVEAARLAATQARQGKGPQALPVLRGKRHRLLRQSKSWPPPVFPPPAAAGLR